MMGTWNWKGHLCNNYELEGNSENFSVDKALQKPSKPSSPPSLPISVSQGFTENHGDSDSVSGSVTARFLLSHFSLHYFSLPLHRLLFHFLTSPPPPSLRSRRLRPPPPPSIDQCTELFHSPNLLLAQWSKSELVQPAPEGDDLARRLRFRALACGDGEAGGWPYQRWDHWQLYQNPCYDCRKVRYLGFGCRKKKKKPMNLFFFFFSKVSSIFQWLKAL